MKDKTLRYVYRKNVILMLLCLLCLIWCLISGFPGLPISKTGDMESVRSMDILVFLKENLFAIV